MSNKRRDAHFFHSRELENALQESIAGYPERILRYSRIRSTSYSKPKSNPKNLSTTITLVCSLIHTLVRIKKVVFVFV